jgi:hypothetical protein
MPLDEATEGKNIIRHVPCIKANEAKNISRFLTEANNINLNALR